MSLFWRRNGSWVDKTAKLLTYCTDSVKTFTILNEAIHSFGTVSHFKASDSTGYFTEQSLNNNSRWVRFYATPVYELHSFPLFRPHMLTTCTKIYLPVEGVLPWTLSDYPQWSLHSCRRPCLSAGPLQSCTQIKSLLKLTLMFCFSWKTVN